MAFKLGQLLINSGRITPQQLDEALRHQVVYGGKLGSILVELGYITEFELSLVLGHKLGVPFIKQEQILALNPEVATLIPAEMAIRYRVIPLEVERRRMNLAMSDPTDLEAIDAISFYTGMIVRPVVCPDLILSRLHDKFYGVAPTSRPSRRRPSDPELTQEQQTSPPDEAAQRPEEVPSSPSPAAEIDEYDLPMFDDFEGFHTIEGDQFENLYLGRPLDHAASMDLIAAELAEARNRDAIADTVLSFLGIAFPVAAFVLVRSETFTGWRARVGGDEARQFTEFSARISDPSALATAYSTKSFFLGPLGDTPVHRELSRILGRKQQGHSLVIPLMILDRVFAMLYVEGDPEQLAARLNELLKLASKTSMAFEILILRNKILMS